MSVPAMRAAARALVAAALVVPTLAAAEDLPLLAMGPVAEARPALVRQLRRAVCAAVECVPWSTVSDGPAVDVDRVRAAGVAGALVGLVERPGRTVELSLFAGRTAPVARWRFRLEEAGTLSGRDARHLAKEIARRLRRARARVAAGRPPAAEPPRAAGAAPEPAPPPPAPPAPPASPASREAAPAELRSAQGAPGDGPPEPPAAAPDDPPRGSPPWLGVELGALAARRELWFPDAAPAPGPLRGHKVPSLLAPDLRLELQPAAWWTDGALAGLSLQGRYASALGAATRVDGVSHRTRVTWLSAGVAWRSAPPAAPRLGVSVGLSWERRDVVVTPAVAGLADRRLSGAKANAGIAAPVRRVIVFAGAGYVRWLEAPDLVAGRRRFFPGGGAWGIDAEGGILLRAGGAWSLRLAGEYALTRYRLERDERGIYAASSAVDEQLAARVALRLDL